MKIQVTLNIEYDETTVSDPDALLGDLRDNMRSAIGNGILTGPHHDTLVDNYNLEVAEVE